MYGATIEAPFVFVFMAGRIGFEPREDRSIVVKGFGIETTTDNEGKVKNVRVTAELPNGERTVGYEARLAH